jgi:hypothetical protein
MLPAMTLQLQSAINVMQEFAATSEGTYVITPSLAITRRCSSLGRILCCCLFHTYQTQLSPSKSIRTFRDMLETVLTSQSYVKSESVQATCRKACASFNRLIKITNDEALGDKKLHEKKLCIDIDEEIRRCSEPQPIRRGESTMQLFRRPGNETPMEEFDALFGDRIRASPKKTSSDPSGSSGSSSSTGNPTPPSDSDSISPQAGSSPGEDPFSPGKGKVVTPDSRRPPHTLPSHGTVPKLRLDSNGTTLCKRGGPALILTTPQGQSLTAESGGRIPRFRPQHRQRAESVPDLAMGGKGKERSDDGKKRQ